MVQVLTPSGRLPSVQSSLLLDRKHSRSSREHHQEHPREWEMIETATGMVRAGVMKIVWESEIHGKNYRIGFLQQSRKLHQNLDSGRLQHMISSISETYREIYGGSPWEEYFCCTDPACGGKMSLQDVYGPFDDPRSLNEKESSRFRSPSEYHCPRDGKEMQYFYDPMEHLQNLTESFHQEVFATILFEDDRKILGFCMGFETTVREGWDDKVIAGTGDSSRENLPYEEYLAEALHLFGNGTQERDKVLNVAEWGVLPEAQRKGTALVLMRELYQNALYSMRDHVEDDVPVFAHTLDGSRAYEVTNRMGFKWGQVLPSGERRAYLTLKKAIQGIDRMMERKSVQITPVSKARELENPNIPRDTLVLEMLCKEAVGTDEDGNQKVHQYLADLANMMGLKPIADSVTHLSPKYGLSGWMPLEKGAAIHLYAWDHEGEDHSPFLSIDISTPGIIINKPTVIKHAEKYFGAKNATVHKNMQKADQDDWKEIAPHILRQRISISGKPQQELSTQGVKDFLKGLAPALNMVQLSEPLVFGQDGWIHWETSGVVLHWDESQFSVDIYTCKAFQERDAVTFTSETLGLKEIAYKSY